MRFSTAAAVFVLSSLGASYAAPLVHSSSLVRRAAPSYAVVNVGGAETKPTPVVETTTVKATVTQSPITITVDVTETATATATPTITSSPVSSRVPFWGSSAAAHPSASGFPGDEQPHAFRRDTRNTSAPLSAHSLVHPDQKAAAQSSRYPLKARPTA
ncbi:hypothetical protein ASPZODRAFT_127580 [Penicilliopsis zonata CBS 506.65]|uniref:Yeast cell wall synthesis Kre9/Knh1 C-terminal domain-containing protein n=1 Tax=Penicilliopsis zonata CBS 506.65 TaxID=1073090 RepID=A0A1L9SWE2_9EURO|nr:hypothetical protein ASPZODRAFT_127580 [Penicilliopsis zonata CBS 506.65]OJJ51499.1 hypothetical protein ASPZODRAFT_127580 [Penicilliopsis zonata CBS 506.65]